MSKTLISDEYDPWPKGMIFGARVRTPNGKIGLIVNLGPTNGTRIVAWLNPESGTVSEATLPIQCLTLLALPLTKTP